MCICTTNLFIRKCIAESKGCRWYELTVFLCTMYSHGIHTAVEMHCWGCNQEWKISPEWDFLNERPSLTQAVGLTLRAPKSVQMKYEGGSFYKLDLQSLLDLKVVFCEGQLLSVFSTPHSSPLGYWLARPGSVGSILHIPIKSPVIEKFRLQYCAQSWKKPSLLSNSKFIWVHLLIG